MAECYHLKSHIATRVLQAGAIPEYCVECDDCKGQGAWRSTKQQALEDWHIRLGHSFPLK